MRKSEQYNLPAFRSFESFVYEWLADKDFAKLDNVFQPQYLFIVDENEELMVDFLGKVESLEDDIARLSVKIERKLDVPDLNRVSAKGSYVELYKNKQLINAVGDLYAKDVTLLRYDFQ